MDIDIIEDKRDTDLDSLLATLRQARRAAKSRAEHGAKHEAEREAAHEAKHEAASAFTFPCLALYFRFMFTLYTSALNFILFFHFYMSDSYFWFRFMI